MTVAEDSVPLDNARGEVVVNRLRRRLDMTFHRVTVAGVASSPLELLDVIAALRAGRRWQWGEDWEQQAEALDPSGREGGRE